MVERSEVADAVTQVSCIDPLQLTRPKRISSLVQWVKAGTCWFADPNGRASNPERWQVWNVYFNSFSSLRRRRGKKMGDKKRNKRKSGERRNKGKSRILHRKGGLCKLCLKKVIDMW